MGVKKRTYTTKNGKKKISPNWAYEFYIDNERFFGSIDGVSFRTKTQAEQECVRLKREKEQLIKGISKVTFSQGMLAYYGQYLKRLNERRELTPHKHIKDRWLYYIEFFATHFGNKYIDEVARQDIATLITELRRKGLKDAGIANYIDCLQATYNHCADMGLCELKDVPNFKSIKRQLAKSKKRTRYLNEAEYDALIKQFEAIPDGRGGFKSTFTTSTRKRMMMFDVETGLRCEELVSLRWEDIKPEIRKVYVRNTKNGKDRYVPLSKVADEILELQRQDTDKKLIKSEYVFPKWNGTKYKSFKVGFREDVIRAKLKDVRIHDLRRTFGSWRLQGIRGKKMTLHEVSLMLGHSSVKQTESTYAFLKEIDINLD